MRKALFLLLKLGFTGLLFYFIFRNFGLATIFSTLKQANPVLIFIAAILLLVSLFTSAIQWRLLLQAQGVLLEGWPAFKLYLIGHFFNNFLPGALGGDVVKVYRLKREIKRGKEALAPTFTDRYAGLFVLAFFALLSSFYIHQFHHIEIETNLFLYIALLFGLFIVSLFFFFSRRVGGFVYGVLLKKINPFGLRDKVAELHDFLHTYRESGWLYAKIFLISTVTQLLRISVHILASRAIGFDVPVVYFLIFVPLIALLSSLPISFGGLGLREGLGSVLFGTISPDRALAVAAQLMASLVGILVSLLGGVLFVA